MINAVAQRALSWAGCGVIAALLIILFTGYAEAPWVLGAAATATAIGFAIEELVRWRYAASE